LNGGIDNIINYKFFQLIHCHPVSAEVDASGSPRPTHQLYGIGYPVKEDAIVHTLDGDFNKIIPTDVTTSGLKFTRAPLLLSSPIIMKKINEV
jgi:hypothetical protein